MLGLGGPAEEIRQLPPPDRLRSGAGRPGDAVEGRVDVQDLQRGRRRGRREVAEGRPAHPDGSLRELGREIRHGDGELVGTKASQQ